MLFSIAIIAIVALAAAAWFVKVNVETEEGKESESERLWTMLKPVGKGSLLLVVAGLLAVAWVSRPWAETEESEEVEVAETEPEAPKSPKAPKAEETEAPKAVEPKAVEAPAEVKCVVESTWTDNGAFESIVVKPSLAKCPLAKSVEGAVVVIFDATGENEVGRVTADSPNLEFAIAPRLD